MFSLNKIIYYLVILVFIKLVLFGIYFLVNKPTSKKIAIQKIVLLENSADFSGIPPFVKEKEEIEVLHKSIPLKIKNVLKNEENKIDILKPKIEKKKTLDEKIVEISPHSLEDIMPIQSHKVQAVTYTKSINLSALSIDMKKKAFINMLMPSILIAKHRIRKDRRRVKSLLYSKNISADDNLWLMKKRHFFKASNMEELYRKMALHPTSIVIAQAIIESGWGTSRFFEEANNVFGIWSFNAYEKRISASQKRGDKTVYLKKYKTVESSIQDYFLMLATKDAYAEFRDARLETQKPFVLIKALGKYSELGEEYVENLRNTIEQNKLLVYDGYRLDI